MGHGRSTAKLTSCLAQILTYTYYSANRGDKLSEFQNGLSLTMALWHLVILWPGESKFVSNLIIFDEIFRSSNFLVFDKCAPKIPAIQHNVPAIQPEELDFQHEEPRFEFHVTVIFSRKLHKKQLRLEQPNLYAA